MIWINVDQTYAPIFASWAKARIGFPGEFKAPIFTMTLMDDMQIRCVVVFNEYNDIDRIMSMHVAAVPGAKWMTKTFVKAVFGYPFVQSNCRKVYGIVKAANAHAIAFDKHLGFSEEGRLRKGAYDGDDYVILGMLRDECRWIGARHAQQRIALAA